MDAFLGELRDDGDQDSEGVFTLALDKASWKLAEFRLADPATYPIHLLACAVANRATSFSATTGFEGVVRFRFDGPTFEVEELKRLSKPLLGEGESRRLKHLAVAINAAGSRNRVRFFSYGTAEGDLELRVQAGQVSVRKSGRSGESGQLMVVEPHQQISLDLGSFVEQCRYAPLRLTVDGQRVDEGIDLGLSEPMTYGYFQVVGSESLKVHAAGETSFPIYSATLEEPESRSMLLALVWAGHAQRHGLLLIADGVCRKLDPAALGFPFLCGAVEVSDLTADISQLGFVENEAYHNMMAQVQTRIDQFLAGFCLKPSQMSANHVRDFRWELLERYQGQIPTEVAEFVAGAGVEPDTAALLAVASRARKSGSWESFEVAVATLRRRCAEHRARGAHHEIQALLSQEGQMRESAGRGCLEWQQLTGIYQYLMGVPDRSQLARQTASDPEQSRLVRFRGLLMSLHTWEVQALQSLLRELEVPAAWSALIHYQLTRGEGAGIFSLGSELADQRLRILVGLESRRFGWALDSISEESMRGSYGLWMDLVWHRFGGDLTFSQLVKLRAKLSMYWSFRASQKEKESRHVLEALLKPHSGFQHEQLFWTHLFSESFLPLLGLRLGILRRSNPEQAMELLGKVLLQLSLGPLGETLHVPRDFPDFPSAQWFPEAVETY